MRSTLLSVLTTAILFLAPDHLRAGPRPAVVELFTSEGCSSCPPAESYLGELAQRPDVLALSFHVDYWDDLGWRDRFDIPEATPRQRDYARALNLSTVYTPQLLIDGHEDYVGSDRRSINHSLEAARSGIPIALAVRDGAVLIRLDPQSGVRPSEVLLVAYQHSAVSHIGRGENSGRTLTEYNIVRAMRRLGSYTGDAGEYRVAVNSLPGDATDVAVLVQVEHQGPMVAAASRSIR